MRGGDLTPLSSGGEEELGIGLVCALEDHDHGCCHGGARVQLSVGTGRVWRCVGGLVSAAGFDAGILWGGKRDWYCLVSLEDGASR